MLDTKNWRRTKCQISCDAEENCSRLLCCVRRTERSQREIL